MTRRCCEACAGLFKCQKRCRKQFSPLWRSCEARASLFMGGKHPQRRFKHRGGAVKHLQFWLSASKDGESSFHCWGSPVKLVQACLCARNTLQHRFNRGGHAVKYMQACSIASKYGESTLHHCGSPVKLVQACLYAIYTAEEVL